MRRLERHFPSTSLVLAVNAAIALIAKSAKLFLSFHFEPSHTLRARGSNPSPGTVTKFRSCNWPKAAIVDEHDPESAEWCQKLVQKGAHLLCMMNADPPTNNHGWPAQSRWQDFEDFEANGWSINVDQITVDILDEEFLGQGFRRALYDPEVLEQKALQQSAGRNKRPGNLSDAVRLMDPSAKNWYELEQLNDLNVPLNAKDSEAKYQKTEGRFINLFSLENYGVDEDGRPVDNGGVVIRRENYSPVWAGTVNLQSKGRPAIPLNRITPLRQLSDVLGLGLKHIRTLYPAWTEHFQNIEHVFMYDVRSAETIEVLQSILGKSVLGVEDSWPGHYFPVTGPNAAPEAKAVLATPNGLGIAYLFAQHKDLFGVRTVEEVRIFNCGWESAKWCIYFHLWTPGSQ